MLKLKYILISNPNLKYIIIIILLSYLEQLIFIMIYKASNFGIIVVVKIVKYLKYV